MNEIFDSSLSFDDDVFRNIVKVAAEESFSDIGDLEGSQAALELIGDFEERLAEEEGPFALDFHYSTAIGYPFIQENFLHSRFSDGSYAAWYGSIDYLTTIHETARHDIIFDASIIGIDETIERDRVIYRVLCQAILPDLQNKISEYPELLSDDYEFCQQLGKKAQQLGQPGLLTRSARCEGSNLVAFRAEILSNPRIFKELVYSIKPREQAFEARSLEGEILSRYK